jgi:septal ring factor EnvC (AmiA/AmiB activator)
MQSTGQAERLQAALAAEASSARERDQASAELSKLRKQITEIQLDQEHLQTALGSCEVERATLHTQVWLSWGSWPESVEVGSSEWLLECSEAWAYWSR